MLTTWVTLIYGVEYLCLANTCERIVWEIWQRLDWGPVGVHVNVWEGVTLVTLGRITRETRYYLKVDSARN